MQTQIQNEEITKPNRTKHSSQGFISFFARNQCIQKFVAHEIRINNKIWIEMHS